METKRPLCPKCQKQLVQPAGNKMSRALIVGEYPNQFDTFAGVPYYLHEKNRPALILRYEMARAGLEMSNFLFTNVWLHYEDDKNCDIQWHINQLAKELKKRDFVLLLGSTPTKALFGKGVMDLTGLELKSELFPKSRFFVAPNPASIMRGSVGEMRLALSRFKEAIDV